MSVPRVTVIEQEESGRNTRFRDNRTGWIMTRAEFVRHIEGGRYAEFHVRVINRIKTPASNPDRRKKNNLG